MKHSLIIGMGIGQLYQVELLKLGHTVITVDNDTNKSADYTNLQVALDTHAPFDTIHICTPNFTHETIANQVAKFTKIVFIEKPGVIDSAHWKSLINSNLSTRFMMVKNNQWREEIDIMKELSNDAVSIQIRWLNRDRVPSPGSWFTTKDLAFGGVSRDLLPHLLSLYTMLNPEYETTPDIFRYSTKMWELTDLTNTEYGIINSAGTYNVDDACIMEFRDNRREWSLETAWRTMADTRQDIEFIMENDSSIVIQLGLCPEIAYHNMIKDALANVDNTEWWANQYKQDCWIHGQIEAL